jgi:hypothetical protein
LEKIKKMTTINLLQNSQNGEGKAVARSSNGGFVFSVGILVVVLLGLGGLKLASSVLTSRSEKLAENVKAENAGLVGQSNIDKVVDMQTRLAEIKKSISTKDDMNVLLDNLGSELVSGVTVRNYEYSSDKKIKVSFVGNGFVDASRQILNLKKSKFFISSNLTDISRTEKGVLFEVDLGIK